MCLEILTPLKSLVNAVAIASFKCFGFGGSTVVVGNAGRLSEGLY
mgnify:CR=1 FL=1